MKFLELISTSLKFTKIPSTPTRSAHSILLGFRHQRVQGLTTKPLGHAVTFITGNDSPQGLGLGETPDLSKYPSEGRPLTVLLTWVHAKDSGVKRYIKFYTDQGFDVLKVRINAYELACPWNIDKVVVNQVLPALLTSTHENKLIHGFSVGGCVYSQILNQFKQHPLIYEKVMKSIRCQILDSFTDISGAKVGISTSVFPSSPSLQKIIWKYLDFYMEKFPQAMNFLTESSNNFHNNPLPVPALFLYSKADNIGTFEVNEGLQKSWRERGVQCSSKVWEDSSHVMHMRTYPEEYQNILKQFLLANGMINKSNIYQKTSMSQEIWSPLPPSNPSIVYFSKNYYHKQKQ